MCFLQLVLLIGLSGLPIVVALSWRFDITASGIALTDSKECLASNQQPRHGKLSRYIDIALLAAGIAIIVQLADTQPSAPELKTTEPAQRIAVFPFDSINAETGVVAKSLQNELQHGLMRTTSMMVTAPLERFRTEETLVLSGFISSPANRHRVTLTLTDGRSGQIQWSEAFEFPADQQQYAAPGLAQSIIASLPAELLAPSIEQIPANPHKPLQASL